MASVAFRLLGRVGSLSVGLPYTWVFESVRLSPLKPMSWLLVGCRHLAACLLLTHSSCKISLKNPKCCLYVTSSQIFLSTGYDTCWKSILPNPEHRKCNN